MTGHAALVAAGIFLSRIAGLVRDRVFAYYFGSSDAADVFRAAFRIPNLLQNLFGKEPLRFLYPRVREASREARTRRRQTGSRQPFSACWRS